MRATPVCIGGNSSVRRKVLGIGAALEFPEPGVFEENAHRAQAAENGAMPPFEYAELQDVRAPEIERRSNQDVAHAGAAPPVPEVVRRPRRVQVDLLEVMAQVP